jgi:hypothetical protein
MADISKIKLPDGTTYDVKDTTARSTADGKVSKTGDTMTGKLTLQANQYGDTYTSGSLDLRNSNINNVNSIYTADLSDDSAEGIHFYRDSTHVDSVYANSGHLYFTPNRPLGSGGSPCEVAVKGISGVNEADLAWGGHNFVASYGPIDAAMISELGANRFAFLKAAGLTVEYSTDGGSSWVDYEATDAQKVGLFSSGNWFNLGKHVSNGSSTVNDQLRVTIATSAAGIYTVLNKIAIRMSTNGNTVYVKMERALESSPNNYVTHMDWTSISGWPGWNIYNIEGLVTYGNVANGQYGRIRFTFKQTAVTTTYAAAGILKIMGFGGVGWTTPSTMAATGHLYSYDSSQNAAFPATVSAANGFNGNLSGTSTAADKLTGFASRSNNLTWGNQTGTTITRMDDDAGGSMGFRKNNPVSGQMSMVIDGTVYVKEGEKRVLDVSDLSTSTSSTSTATVATSSAVKTAYDLANTANGTANTALSGVNGNLIYDHTFTISNGIATFTPHVYQKGSEVTTNYAKSCFTWKYRKIDGTEIGLTTKNDRGCDVTITSIGYGGHVIGIFTPA